MTKCKSGLFCVPVSGWMVDVRDTCEASPGTYRNPRISISSHPLTLPRHTLPTFPFIWFSHSISLPFSFSLPPSAELGLPHVLPFVFVGVFLAVQHPRCPHLSPPTPTRASDSLAATLTVAGERRGRATTALSENETRLLGNSLSALPFQSGTSRLFQTSG